MVIFPVRNFPEGYVLDLEVGFRSGEFLWGGVTQNAGVWVLSLSGRSQI